MSAAFEHSSASAFAFGCGLGLMKLVSVSVEEVPVFDCTFVYAFGMLESVKLILIIIHDFSLIEIKKF